MSQVQALLGLPLSMSERLLPSDDPVAEQVLEWTIQRDSADIRQLMQWVERSDGRKERLTLLARAAELMDEIRYAMQRLADLRSVFEISTSRRWTKQSNGPR